VAKLLNATWRPSVLTEEAVDQLFAWFPELSVQSRRVAPETRSWTNTSGCPFSSRGTRSGAEDPNTM
jgi:hypothetical protein